VSLARALSKLGLCSRSQASGLITAGRVSLNGVTERNPATRIDPARDRIAVDRRPVGAARKVYLALNKPRGLVTTRADAEGRETVYACLRDPTLPYVAPVGRLDKASEGLLLFTNDTRWAARILDPATHVDKVYHVHVDRHPDDALLQRMLEGVRAGHATGDVLTAKRVRVLRQGTRTSWLEIVLDEGKNRHIRRLLATLGLDVRRLVRVAIGPLALGPLRKGETRHLTPEEREALGEGKKNWRRK
jgi:23S rRNA pseudouridine2605 synthase